MGSKLALQVIEVNHPNSDPLAKEKITFPPGAASFVKETHSAPLKTEKFFSGCSIAKHHPALAL
jgi:hypothetical protein